MSEAVLTTIISTVASLIVAFGTWTITMKKDREKQMTEIKDILNNHRDEYLGKIRDVQDDITNVNSTVQQQVAIIEVKISDLSKEVEKHNQVIERTFKLEQTTAVHEEKIKVANHRLDDLERRAN